ncbi:hypothetical protein ACERK3_02710 [Phycisphaerales bacterium AB-hyl4]|uniref:Uncharacterized protein n=1 Tax=Natronomicrosphaera hydrolytica TaxID=3242702 RepID=A0ABV4U0R9_9BACT
MFATIFLYVGVLLVLAIAMAVASRRRVVPHVIEVAEAEGPWCDECGCSLRSLSVLACPECGSAVDQPQSIRLPPSEGRRRRWLATGLAVVILVPVWYGMPTILVPQDYWFRIDEVWEVPSSQAYESIHFMTFPRLITAHSWVDPATVLEPPRGLEIYIRTFTGDGVALELQGHEWRIHHRDEVVEDVGPVSVEVAVARLFQIASLTKPEPDIEAEMQELQQYLKAVLQDPAVALQPRQASHFQVTTRTHIIENNRSRPFVLGFFWLITLPMMIFIGRNASRVWQGGEVFHVGQLPKGITIDLKQSRLQMSAPHQ